MDNKCVSYFNDNIKILQTWRKNLWDVSSKNMIVMYLPLIQGICDTKQQLMRFKDYVPMSVYLNFDREFSMTMYLLYKCILRIRNKNYSLNPEQTEAMEVIKSKLSGILLEIDVSEVKTALNNEYLKTLKESLGLSDSIIQAAIQKGISVNNVLNEEDYGLKL